MQSPVYEGTGLQKIVSKVGTWSTFSSRNKVIYGGLMQRAVCQAGSLDKALEVRPGLAWPGLAQLPHLNPSHYFFPYILAMFLVKYNFDRINPMDGFEKLVNSFLHRGSSTSVVGPWH